VNCPDCNYSLFGLTAPRCPECGREFAATDFSFRPGAVHFLCPHCSQAYAGNDAFGLPSPREFRCVRCRKHVAAASMIVKPVRPDARGEPLRFGNVWEHRRSEGFVRAFFDALGQLAFQARGFFRESYFDPASALMFGMLCGYFTAFVGVVALEVFQAVRPNKLPDPLMQFLQPSGWMILLVMVPAGVLVWMYVNAFLILLTLRMLGRTADMDATLQVVAYAGAVLPAMILPIIGLPWYLAIIAAGIEQVTGASRLRAFVAALLPLLLCLNAAILAVAFQYL